MDQSGVMQSVTEAVTVFSKSYANALSVFIACAAFSSAEVHLRTLLQRVEASKWLLSRPVQRFRTPERLSSTPGAVFSSAQVAPERTRAVFPNAKVAAGGASAAFTGAQVAPKHVAQRTSSFYVFSRAKWIRPGPPSGSRAHSCSDFERPSGS